MRQIQVGAWLLLALTACGGGEFSSGGLSKPEGTTASSGTGAPGKSTDFASGGSATHDFDAASGGPSNGDAAAEAPPPSGGMSFAGKNSYGGQTSNGARSGAGEAADSAADCSSGSLTFRMLPSSKLTAGYLCDAGCGTGWLSITDEDGAMGFPISSACGTASCESCEVRQCAAAACLPTPLTAAGSELRWNGTYLAKDTCGESDIVCQRQDCVKPGKYKARACSAINGGANATGGCTPKDEQLCTEVEFEFPATKTVELELGT